MKLTSERSLCSYSRFRYCFRNADGGPVSLADISERQHISFILFRATFAKLRKDGLVKSVRGPGRWLSVRATSEQISVGMIIAAVNENIHVTKCLGREDWVKWCGMFNSHELWEDLSLRIESFLNEITLARAGK